MPQRNKYSSIDFQFLHFFFQTLLLREWRRLITKSVRPVLIKLETGEMNIEIKLQISFQITVNKWQRKTCHLSGQEVPLLSDLIVISQKSKAKNINFLLFFP